MRLALEIGLGTVCIRRWADRKCGGKVRQKFQGPCQAPSFLSAHNLWQVWARAVESIQWTEMVVGLDKDFRAFAQPYYHFCPLRQGQREAVVMLHKGSQVIGLQF